MPKVRCTLAHLHGETISCNGTIYAIGAKDGVVETKIAADAEKLASLPGWIAEGKTEPDPPKLTTKAPKAPKESKEPQTENKPEPEAEAPKGGKKSKKGLFGRKPKP